MQKQAAFLSESRVVIYKKGQIVAPKDYFIVEISTEHDQLFVAAYSVINNESFLLTERG